MHHIASNATVVHICVLQQSFKEEEILKLVYCKNHSKCSITYGEHYSWSYLVIQKGRLSKA